LLFSSTALPFEAKIAPWGSTYMSVTS
jgi:hypothetical protein